ncbi:MAG: hypothetical protein ACRECH_14550 [Nitrososphaerales archaeon]
MHIPRVTMIGIGWIFVVSFLYFVVKYPAISSVGYLALLFFGIVLTVGAIAFNAVR